MLIVIAGWVSAVLVFSSFFMKTMVPLRMVAICSNVAFITYALLGLKYGVFGRVYPIFVLHAALLPLNVIRLRQLKGSCCARCRRRTRTRRSARLCPVHAVTETTTPATFLFRKGDPADRLYVIDRGHVRFPEIGKVVSAGQVFGEVGVFAVENVRTLSAVCEEDCRIATPSPATRRSSSITRIRSFGLFLIRLVAGLVVENQGLAGPTLTRPA